MLNQRSAADLMKENINGLPSQTVAGQGACVCFPVFFPFSAIYELAWRQAHETTQRRRWVRQWTPSMN